MTDFRKLTDEELLASIQERLTAVEQPRIAGKPSMGRGDKADFGMIGGFLRGMRDPVDAGAQLAVRGANVVGLAPDSEVQRVEGINRGAEQDYRQNWRGGNDVGADIPRIAGFGATTGLATMPSKIAPTLLGRMGQGAKMGGAGGLATPVDDPKSNADFFAKKGLQGGAGALVGGLGTPVVEMGMQGIANIASRVIGGAKGAVKGAMGEWSEQNAAAIARQSLKGRGVDFDSLSDKVQQSLVSDVQEAMRKYGGVDPKALSREADFRALGVDPLKPWVTRNPIEFGRAKNLEATDAGDPLKMARAKLDETLLGRLESLRGGNTGGAYQSGSVAGKALKDRHEAAKARVSTLYDQFRQTAPDVSADPKRLVDTALDSIEKDALGDFLGPLRNLINDFATGRRPTTPDSLFRAQQVANAQVRKGGPEGMAAKRLADAIDNELEQMGRDMSAVGPEMKNAAELLKKARGAHRSLKMAEESIPALKAVADGAFDPEDFLRKYVVGGSVNEVAAMWKAVDDQGMKAAARSQIVDALKDAARGRGAGDDAATFAQARYSQFLSSPGMKEKLGIILGPKGLKDVELVQRAAESAIKIPAGSRYNTSGSAMELMNLSRRIPVIGPLVSEPLKGMADEVAATGLQRAGSAAFGQRPLDPFTEQMLQRIRRGASLLSPTVGAGGANLATGLLGYSK